MTTRTREHWKEWAAWAPAVCSVLLVRFATAGAQEPQARPDSGQRLDTVAVVVGGPPPPSPLLQATAVSVADSARVASSPSRILPDILRELPGVQAQQTNAGHGTVILRGMTGNQVLVLIDGVRLNTAITRDGPNQYLATIDPERIERVEVVRGPGSVLYGSDAMGGVVNVITKRPSGRTAAAGALAYATSDDGVRAHVEGNVARDRVRARGGVTLSSADELRAGRGIGVQPWTGYRSAAADAAINVALRPCDRVSLSAQGMQLTDVSRYDRLVDFRYDSTSLGPDAEFEFDPQVHLLGMARYEGTGCGGAVPNRGLSLGEQHQQEGRRQRALVQDSTGAPVPAPEREYLRDDTRTRFLTFFLEPRTPLGVSLRLGGDVYRDRVASHGYEEDVISGARTPVVRIAGDDTIPAGRFPNGARSTTLGVYAHGARPLGSRVRLLGGLRYDAVRVTLRAGDDFGGDVDARNTKLSGQLGATMFFDDGLSVSAHLGQGFRAPNIYDLATVSTVPGGIVLPSATLEPERSLTYEVAVRRVAERYNAALVAYITDIDGFIDRVPGSYRGDTLFEGQRVFRAANIGEARIGGLEWSGEATFGRRWSFRSQAFWTRGSQTAAGGVGREPVGRIPPLTGSLALRRTIGADPEAGAGGWLELVVRGAGAQRRLSSRDQRDSRIQPGGTPGFVTVGLRGSIAHWRARLTGGIENIFDRGYREHGSGIDAPGRHVWVRVDIAG